MLEMKVIKRHWGKKKNKHSQQELLFFILYTFKQEVTAIS